MNKELIENTLITEASFTKLYEQEITRIICRRLGIVIHSHQVHELFKTVKKACQQFGYTLPEYINTIQNCTPQSPVLEQLVTGITVGETYFYRDSKQMTLIQEQILPQLIKARRDAKELSLRIWSAGCASGEELYTMAIMLNEILPDLKDWNISLLGTDINTNSLRKALAGQYTEWSMRSIPEYIKNKYFQKNEQHYILSEKIKQMARFDYINLNDDSYPSIFNNTSSQDLILCRNVLIYFDMSIIANLMKKFSASLQPNSYLLLGASDPIDIKSVKNELRYLDGMLFNKLPLEAMILPTPVIEAQNKLHVKSLPRTSTKKALPIHSNIKNVKTKHELPAKEDMIQLMETCQWQSILMIVDNIDLTDTKHSIYQYFKAVALANLGELSEATKYFKKSLAVDPTNKYGHFTYALTLLELNRLTEAEDELRKSLFLDKDFVAGHYQLGLLMMRIKQQKAGIKSLNNALSIALSKNPTDLVSGSSGVSFAKLTEILKHEISIYTGTKE